MGNGAGDDIVETVRLLFVALVLLAALRLTFILAGAIMHAALARRQNRSLRRDLRAHGFWPPVSILVPAYNEGPVIEAALNAALTTAYPDFEVIVIDDGSIDDTVARVAAVRDRHARVRLVVHPVNRGKAAALNTGLRAARHDFIVTMDADTWLTPRTVKYLTLSLLSGRQVGVTANLKIGNQTRLLTLWQQIEYVTGIHVERRTQSLFGCVMILAGACSGFRRDAVEAAGGFPSGTLAEDTDLTLTLLEMGHEVGFEPRAVALTEAPSSVDDLQRQRFRWIYGTFQCIRRHWRPTCASSNTLLKYLFIPNFIFASILPVLFFPFFLGAVTQTLMAGSLGPILMLPAYFAIDILATVVAFAIEGERRRLLIQVLPQRIFYVFLLAWVFARVILAALRRSRPGWGDIRRMGMDQDA
ncbi:MAG: glycosyltransferase [Alphaproteobacteria bacterium]